MKRRTRTVKLALTEAEYERLVGESQVTGIRLAVLCREKALKGKIITPAPKVNLEAYRVLRGLANNLNQVVRYLNTERNLDSNLHSAIGRTLSRVNAVSQEVIASGNSED